MGEPYYPRRIADAMDALIDKLEAERVRDLNLFREVIDTAQSNGDRVSIPGELFVRIRQRVRDLADEGVGRGET